MTKFPVVPVIAVTTRSLQFAYTVGGAAPPGQSLQITNSGGGTLIWSAISSAPWLSVTPTSGTAPSTILISVAPAGFALGTYAGTITISAAGVAAQTVSVTLAVDPPPPPPPPTPAVSGTVNGASFAAGAPVAPGSMISIFGSNLATSEAAAGSTPLPTGLLTTSVTINGVPIPLYYVSPTQINAQVPFETPTGTATLAVTVSGVLSPGGVLSPAVTFPVAATAPGIFLYGANRAVAQNPDGSINASNNPAKPGDVIVLYMTGQGAVSNPIPTGAPAQASPLSEALATTTATIGGTIGGTGAEVLFSGLTPGFVGLLQVNLRIPTVAAGDRPLVVTIGGVATQSALITVGSP